MQITVKESCQPAPGFQKLTTKQLLEIDAKVASLGAYAAATGQELMMVIYINKNGHPTSIGAPLEMSRLSAK